MPYRRLPNTDVARLRALTHAYKKGKEIPPFKLAYSQITFNKVQSFLPSFEAAVKLYKNTYTIIVNKNKDYPAHYRKAKLYISHFIQVLNMAIARGELHANVRSFYGIDEQDSKVPDMNTEAEVIKWGEQVIQGETDRLKRGMTPISNPTIAVVKVRYENFMEAYWAKKINQKNSSRVLNDVSTLRTEADNIIVSVWNEVEKHYTDLPDDMMREHAKEYGLIYVYRKNELEKIKPIASILSAVSF